MLQKDDIQKIAKLSKFDLTESEVEKLQPLLNEALGYIEVLDELDTKGIVPTPQVTELGNALNQDEIGDSLSQTEALFNAPQKKDGFFVTGIVVRK